MACEVVVATVAQLSPSAHPVLALSRAIQVVMGILQVKADL
jgi:hypothetical protein